MRVSLAGGMAASVYLEYGNGDLDAYRYPNPSILVGYIDHAGRMQTCSWVSWDKDSYYGYTNGNNGRALGWGQGFAGREKKWVVGTSDVAPSVLPGASCRMAQLGHLGAELVAVTDVAGRVCRHACAGLVE